MSEKAEIEKGLFRQFPRSWTETLIALIPTEAIEGELARRACVHRDPDSADAKSPEEDCLDLLDTISAR